MEKMVSSLAGRPPATAGREPHDHLFLLGTEVQDGQDGSERLLAAQGVRQGKEAVNDIFEVLQIGALPALVPDVLFNVAL